MTGPEVDRQQAASDGAAPLVLVPGAMFRDRYRVVRCIKAGGMGAVYEVLDTATNSRRALKVMLATVIADADLRSRFVQEAKVTGEIESEHITRVLDAGVDDATKTPFMVMDLLRGEDLGAVIDERGALPPAEAVHYAYQAALGLSKTHEAGIVHRDLKPENLFVTRRDDGSPCLKLLDFGIAKVVVEGTDPDKATRAMGTPLYMAPEQVRGMAAVGPATDVYALGNVVYSLLVGEAYWRVEKEAAESSFLLMVEIVAGAQEAASERALRRRGVELPKAFDAWFTRATAILAEDRFPSAMDAVAALAEALEVDLPQPRFVDPASARASKSGTTGDTARSRSGLRDPVPAKSGSESERRAGESTATEVAVASNAAPPVKRRGAVATAAAIAGVAIAVGAAALLSGGKREARAPAQPAPTQEASAAASGPAITPLNTPTASAAPIASAPASPDAGATTATVAASAPPPRPRAATTAPAPPKKHGIF